MVNDYHPVTWLIWTLAAAVIALLTLNPLYLALLTLAAWVNYLAVGRRSPVAQSWGIFIKLGLLIWALTIPFNALMVHHGMHVLFTLPAHWPLIGGNITLDAIAYGFARGFSLISVLIVFATFNSAVDQARLLRRMPAFLYLVSMVTSIALAFVPQMFVAMKEIREAQRLRGHKFRGIRDLLPLFVPLLTTGMERAVQLAESMESRGFGGNVAPATPRTEVVQRLMTLLGLAGLFFGIFASSYWSSRQWIGALVTVLGAVLLTLVFWMQSRRVRRTRYRRDIRLTRDWVVMGTSVLALAGLLLARMVDRAALFYYPYPPYSIWPAFDPRIGVMYLLFVAPAILLPTRETVSHAEQQLEVAA